MVAQTYNSHSCEMEKRGSRVEGQSVLHSFLSQNKTHCNTQLSWQKFSEYFQDVTLEKYLGLKKIRASLRSNPHTIKATPNKAYN